MPGPLESPGAIIARQVRDKGVNDPRVLGALAEILATGSSPRKTFEALDDRAVEIGLGQTISQPFMVAVMTAELSLNGSERVLEIGTGSGYQAAVLARLAAEVYTVERHRELSLRARAVLDGLGLMNLHYRIGDGTLGWSEEAPFDRILVTAGAPSLPSSLFEQLAEGGILVAPIGGDTTQELTVIRKTGGRPEVRKVFSCHFVKLIGEEGWHESIQ